MTSSCHNSSGMKFFFCGLGNFVAVLHQQVDFSVERHLVFSMQSTVCSGASMFLVSKRIDQLSWFCLYNCIYSWCWWRLIRSSSWPLNLTISLRSLPNLQRMYLWRIQSKRYNKPASISMRLLTGLGLGELVLRQADSTYCDGFSLWITEFMCIRIRFLARLIILLCGDFFNSLVNILSWR